MKFGAPLQLHRAPPRLAGQPERHVHASTPTCRSIRPTRRTYPERLSIRTGHVRRVHQEPHLRGLRPGQVADRAADDAQPRRSLRPRDHPARRDRQSAVLAGDKQSPVDKNNISPRVGVHALARRRTASRSSAAATGSSTTARSSARSTTRSSSASSRRRTSSTSRPTAPIPGRAPGGCRPTRTWSTDRSSTARCSIRRIRPACAVQEQRRRDLRLAGSDSCRTRTSSRSATRAS